MSPEQKSLILTIMDRYRVMSLATLRPDGWPLATSVAYGNDGMVLYFLAEATSQKIANLKRDNRAALTINPEKYDILTLEALNLAATAEFLTDQNEIAKAFDLIMRKSEDYIEALPPPDASFINFVRITPKIISLIDYNKGNGHHDILEVSPADLSRSF
jgi:nitroimidazol reductase NimA-like FMN-containing flavoprotein (pyridoxamine 5'-phosphate oxidase superfamily)